MPAKILVVDDHAIVRHGLRSVLDGDSPWEICGEAENGKDAIEKALALKPDLVLMDISMPVMNGIEATRQLRRLLPQTKIVILSLHDSEQIASQAKEAGANAYVIKSQTSAHLYDTILSVLALDRPSGSPKRVATLERT